MKSKNQHTIQSHSAEKAEEKKGLTIFLIDDDPDFLEIHSKLLKDRGYTVMLFQDPQSAFEQMNKSLPDLLITDLMLTDLNSGFTVIQTIRQNSRTKHIPLILVTAISSERGISFAPQSEEELEEMGVQAFFEKPVHRDKLLKTIQQLLHQKPSKDD